METKRGFGSRFGHIMALAGFCIGIGNMWKFPYMVGANGGGVFLVIYIISVIFAGLPLFILEQQLGRSSRLSGIAGMSALAPKHKTFWSVTGGWFGVITIILIAGYFWTILGWNIGYIFKVADGSFLGLNADSATQMFVDFSGSWGCVGCAAIAAVLCFLIMSTDFKKGVEKVCKIALPLLIVLMIGLACYSCSLPGAGKGVEWYLKPEFAGTDILSVIQAAVVQVFYSVGVGMACAFVYGSYLKKEENLVGGSVTAVILDTCVAFLSGLVITPALFAFGIEPTAGPGLVFISLPQLFAAMGPVVGRIFGLVFMFAVFLACLTSMVAVLEAIIANLGDKFGWSRKRGRNFAVIFTFVLSIFVTLNQGTGVMSGATFFGMDLFSLLDMLASAFGLTLGAIFMTIFVIFVMKFDRFRKEANEGARVLRIGGWMKWYYNIIIPIILVFVFYCILRMYFG